MPKIVDFALPPGGTIIDLADDQSVALEIEGVDSKDYLIVTTTDGSEAITIKGGGSAGLAVHENNQVRSTVADGWVFLSSDPTDTSPNICPSQKDLNTGIGHGAGGNTDSDQLSLIAGGVEGIRLTESGSVVVMDVKGRAVITADTSGTPDDLGDFDNYTLVLQGSSSANDETALLLSSSVDVYGGSAIVHKDTGPGGKGELSFYTKQSEVQEPPVKVMTLTDSGGVTIAGAMTHTGNVEIENASPTLTFDNTTAEDTDGGRESQMDFTGLKTGGGSPAAVTMARVQGSHDGTGDDSKGKISFLTSDGSSLAERFRIHNDGKVGLGSAGLSRSELFCVRQSFTGGEELALIENTGDGNALTVQAASGTASTKVFDVKRAAGSMLTAFGDGKITTGGETSALCKAGGIHLLTGTQTGVTANTDAQDLVIESNATELGITFAGGNSSRQRIQFADIASNAAAAIAFNHADNDMTFWSGNGFQKFYFLEEGYVQVNLATPTAMLAAEGNLITQGAGTIESISTATVTGSGTSFTTVLQAGDAIKFTNDADGTEIRTVKQINSNTELVLTETPGATGAGRSTKTYFIDPALLSLTTGDSVSKLSVKKSGVGVNVADPDFPLHVVGPGGGQDLSGVTGAPVADGEFSAMFDNSTVNGNDRNRVGINTNGSGGSLLSLYRNATEAASFFSYGSSGTYLDAKNGELHLRTIQTHKMDFFTNNTLRMGIDSDGPVWVGSNSTSLSNNEFEVTNGSRYIAFDIQGTTQAINFAGDGLGSGNKLEMTIGSHAGSNIKFSKYGIAYAKYQLGEINTWNNDQTNANRSAYLDDSNTDLNLQFQLGNVGMIELVDNVDKIKLWGLPSFGGVITFTLRIKQHASAAKTLSYSTIEFSSSTPGGSALSGTTTFNWAGGAPHVMSTGTGNIDIVQFTAFCDTTNNVDVYASVIGQNFS